MRNRGQHSGSAWLTLLGAVCAASYSSAQIPEGFEIERIAVNPDGARHPRLSKCGQIVYSYYVDAVQGTDILLYDNGLYANLSEMPGYEVLPDINNAGAIAWVSNADGASHGEIQLYREGHVVTLSAGYRPRLCDSGGMVFQFAHQKTCAYEVDLLYYDGENSELLYADGRSNQSAATSSKGRLIWTNYDFCLSPWESEIVGWDANEAFFYPGIDEQRQLPAINDAGLAAWSSLAGLETYYDGELSLLAVNAASTPAVNNRGSIYYSMWDWEIRRQQPWLWRDGRHFRLAVDRRRSYSAGDINDWDEVVFSGNAPRRNYEWSIYYMRRIRTGEYDFDGDFDLADHREWARCLDGPDFLERNRTDPTDTLCDCRFLDLDHDNDVDLRDFARFQNAFAPGR